MNESKEQTLFDDADYYALSYASLARAYGDDEPEYTETDLVWKNANYIKPDADA